MRTIQLLNKPHYHGAFLLVALFLGSYFEILSWVIKGWFTLDNAYSFIIFLLCIYMIWHKRKELRQQPIYPNTPWGSLLITFGCFILIVGKLSSTLMLQGIAFVFSLLGTIWLVFGNGYIRILWIPVSYLIFMFYLFEEILSNFSIHFQKATAWISAHLLEIGGMPVILKGHLIQLPHISLEVAKVCNGINHLLALVAIAIPFAFTSSLTRPWKILTVAVAATIGILANGLRVTMIGIWTKFYPDGSLHGPFDIFYVSFILFFGLVFFFLIAAVSKKYAKHHQNSIKPKLQADVMSKPTPRNKLFAANIIGIAIFFTTSLYLLWHNPQPSQLEFPLHEFPLLIGDWKGRTITEKSWPIKNLTADDTLKRQYNNQVTGDEIGLYVGYFHSQHQNKELINDQLSWLHLREKRIPVQMNNERLLIARGQARGIADQTYKGDSRLFYFWYWIDGNAYVDRYTVKLHLLMESLFKNKTSGALIIVSVDKDTISSKDLEAPAVDFIRQAYHPLKDALSSIN